jgi:hypothetical protein
MKKLLGILVLSLLLIFPLSVNNSYSFFDTPVEKCMDKLQDKNIYITAAAKFCNKFTKESLKCMNKLEDKGIYITAAAKFCNGGNNGSFACMKRLIKKNIYVTAAAKKCFGT